MVLVMTGACAPLREQWLCGVFVICCCVLHDKTSLVFVPFSVFLPLRYRLQALSAHYLTPSDSLYQFVFMHHVSTGLMSCVRNH